MPIQWPGQPKATRIRDRDQAAILAGKPLVEHRQPVLAGGRGRREFGWRLADQAGEDWLVTASPTLIGTSPIA